MKLTLQQEENLKTYLRKELSYRETYEEVYDHILTALEQKPKEIPFQDSINQIISNDFGGGKGLVEMEKKCYQLVEDEANSQQWNYFKSNFRFPNLIYTLILFLTFCFIVSKFTIAPFIILFLIFIGILIPIIFMLIRYYFIGYFTLDTKKSIKDKIMWKIALKYTNLITFILIYKKDIKIFNSWINDYPILVPLVALTIICYLLYITSFVKLSRDEFKFYTAR